ncbi:MAG: hypothetical protein KA120_04685 [Candidatus Goldbacteria bacterium]|nr:hypothetical protein [Candidatus Goldiibacteriota bacterium]
MKKSIQLRGYLGELICKKWLKNKYKGCRIVEQIRPKNYPTKGGPYLDFGVLNEEKKVIAIYEVKTQDYNLDTVNKALLFIWENGEKEFVVGNEEGEIYETTDEFQAYAVLLKKPSEKGKGCIKNIIYFEEILKEINVSEIKEDILDEVNADIEKEIESILNIAKRK